ncbi:hypothetical protein HanXRQr2_Chr14g0660801 [Helianthus annuus]|uniref:Lipoprotein n=1 Tax=Helianthus annuus TaxID=4232 RepID=A0A9K3ECE1_HELAN|nr:hypothetical protein HanXRQr2_Chr14g0660801 [Helianthus annuus]KAJ0470283.1 hypothetical protein HanIR_Chr14g0717021 [Helianthus annuus]KAJ0661176.1 hypothetical protein HanOQP8_Chr14g0545711 [Helianthus annuus]KAJ0841761.1 hypothetical protein HanPSC8_Chr14g0634031 [Helianthus annuus]
MVSFVRMMAVFLALFSCTMVQMLDKSCYDMVVKDGHTIQKSCL